MKILNTHAGLGGNRKKWGPGHEVTAIEMDPKIAAVYQKENPNDKVIIGDAMEYVKKHRNEYDLVWCSPPCQKHGRMMKATRHDVADYFDPTLYQLIIFLTHFYKGKWVVENVKPYYTPLIKPTCVMGRHYFWANFEIQPINVPNIKGFITNSTANETQKMKDWLGIQYEGNIYYGKNHCPGQVLRNCVHPDVGLHILNESMREGLFNKLT
ncbi:MAG: DNA cytosine methyltransferase [Desulfotalea sp.]|nr:MAG: DNA cytosine methyltransferase [Desulfotalea sp.]